MNRPTSGAKRVIIIDDDIVARQWISQRLQSTTEYLCVGTYADGREALGDHYRSCPQIALVDLFLPEMDGLECIQRLRHLCPNCNCVLFNGLSDADTLHKVRQIGAQGYLATPLQEESLMKALNAVVSAQFPYVNSGLELLPPVEAVTAQNPDFVPSLTREILFGRQRNREQMELRQAIARSTRFRVAKLAALCRLSQGQLKSQFHQGFQMSAREWLRDCQMKEAGTLLLKQVSIKECARQLGYLFESNFCAEFSRHFHCTPSQFVQVRP